MRKLTMAVGITLLSAVLGACANRDMPVSPLSPRGASFETSSAGDRPISIFDACDGPTFTAQGVDCSRTSGLRFDQFVSELTAHGSVGAWHFAATNVNVFAGQTLTVTNHGGETHTFTEVAHFGGGIVPFLNQLSGNPVPAPECLELSGSDFIAAGDTRQESVDESGTEMYQCCIHPWMRVVVSAK